MFVSFRKQFHLLTRDRHLATLTFSPLTSRKHAIILQHEYKYIDMFPRKFTRYTLLICYVLLCRTRSPIKRRFVFIQIKP